MLFISLFYFILALKHSIILAFTNLLFNPALSFSTKIEVIPYILILRFYLKSPAVYFVYINRQGSFPTTQFQLSLLISRNKFRFYSYINCFGNVCGRFAPIKSHFKLRQRNFHFCINDHFIS